KPREQPRNHRSIRRASKILTPRGGDGQVVAVAVRSAHRRSPYPSFERHLDPAIADDTSGDANSRRNGGQDAPLPSRFLAKVFLTHDLIALLLRAEWEHPEAQGEKNAG